MTPEYFAVTAKYLAVNVSLQLIEAFETEQAMIARCPGVEVLEGNWLFFAPSGSPLAAHFSQPPRIYSLRAAEGPTFQAWLSGLCAKDGGFRFGTLDYLRRWLS
ncbi:MAG TPA: hypothetical protein VG839_00990 [Asticcacaulis sp.]|nr:hypothetical protein [Asticcacaulis sp.]